MDFDELVESRSTIKRYSSEKPPVDEIIEAIESANLSFTHGNVHATKFIVVEDIETKDRIAEACQQDYISTAPYLIVICTDPKSVKRLFDIRTDKYLKHHAGASAENLLLKLHDLGMAASWVGAFSEVTIRDALKIPDNINIEMIITAGYEFHKGRKKQSPKPSLVNRVFFHTYGNKFHKPIKSIRRDDT